MIALKALVPDVKDLPELQVESLAIDSRDAKQGSLFIALKGSVADGHDHIDTAIANGAVAVLSQREVESCSVPLVVLDDLSSRVSQISGEFFGHPSKYFQCVAVTGTNGKTSVAHFVAALATELGISAGFLGTTGWGRLQSGQELLPATLTTADAISLQARMAQLKAEGCELVALELSSHALQQHRGDALDVDIALFTNLTRDHLDYHGSMQAYGAAKARLFEFESLRGIVINADDSFGEELAAQHTSSQTANGAESVKLVLLGNTETHESEAATLRVSQLKSTRQGLSWKLVSPWGDAEVSSPVIGSYNSTNLSLAVAALALLGYDFQRVIQAVPAVSAPRGRLERVTGLSADAVSISVFVDYAHTPDALESMLLAVRAHCEGRLICVFGCGGDRDKGKRGPMGRAVQRFADVGVLTSDNPRFEAPDSIIKDVEAGLESPHQMLIEPDRAKAIALAIGQAQANDVVIIAGKGHEDYQEIRGERLPFSDVEVAQELLAMRASQGGQH